MTVSPFPRATAAFPLATLLAGVSVALPARAQPGAPQPVLIETRDGGHRVAVGVDAGFAAVPAPFTNRCGYLGRGAALMVRGSATARVWSAVVVQADVGLVSGFGGGDCVAIGRGPVQVGPDLYEDRSWPHFDEALVASPLPSGSLRVGLQTPPRAPSWAPLVRLAAGIGVLAPSRTPYGVGALSVGTRGARRRIRVDVERATFRLDVSEQFARYRLVTAPRYERTELDHGEHRYDVGGRWTAVRVGVEFPLARGRG